MFGAGSLENYSLCCEKQSVHAKFEYSCLKRLMSLITNSPFVMNITVCVFCRDKNCFNPFLINV